MCRFKSSLPARGAGPFTASAEASGAARARRPLREPAPGRAASPAGRGGARGKRARPAEPGGQGRAGRGRGRSSRGERPEQPRCLACPIGSHPAPRAARRGAVSERAGGGGAERRLRAPCAWPGRARRASTIASLAPLSAPSAFLCFLGSAPPCRGPPNLVHSSLLCLTPGPPDHGRFPSPETRRKPDFPHRCWSGLPG